MTSKHYKRHGMINTPTYVSWTVMKSRCTDKNVLKYPSYGGRGIAFCTEWEFFINFYNDMGDRPEGKTLDRIDNSKGYCKENCKWSTAKEQANNRRNSSKVSGVGFDIEAIKWKARTSSTAGKEKHIGRFVEWWDAVCARKSWENKNELL